MEIEKSSDQIEAEKAVYDESGHSERMTDIQLNRTTTDTGMKQTKKVAVFQENKKKETVLLDTSHE